MNAPLSAFHIMIYDDYDDYYSRAFLITRHRVSCITYICGLFDIRNLSKSNFDFFGSGSGLAFGTIVAVLTLGLAGESFGLIIASALLQPSGPIWATIKFKNSLSHNFQCVIGLRLPSTEEPDVLGFSSVIISGSSISMAFLRDGATVLDNTLAIHFKLMTKSGARKNKRKKTVRNFEGRNSKYNKSSGVKASSPTTAFMACTSLPIA
uniref:Uncharacterized protein n=1 Tax=Glossina austeni TaxID=7395 RepID=A0A1A9VFW3_GLOAU